MIDGILSLILFVIELILLIIICVKNRNHPQFWIIFTIMLLLQTYQLSEFLLCIGVAQNIVVRLAFSIITFLPPTGYLLTIRVLKCKRMFVQLIFYSSLIFATILSLYLLFWDTEIVMQDCNPIYAIYQIGLQYLFGVYYNLVIFLALLVIFYQFIFKRVLKHNLKGLLVLIGYLSFLLPMIITLIVDPQSYYAVTSIMCKYAILLAFMLLIFSFYKEK